LKLRKTIDNGEVYFIAEMSGNHGGSLGKALEIVRAAAEAGAHCLKTQTYTADTITINCDAEDFQTVKGGLWEGRTLHDLYEEAHTPWEWQLLIKEECEKFGMDFLSSVFDFSSVDYLEDLGVEAYKIASPELVDTPLIKYAASKQKTMIMSCGMASLREIEDAVGACLSVGNDDIVLLKCTSEYPAIYSDMNIKTICDMKERFPYTIGLSDHSMGYAVDVAAVALGAEVIEKHFCITRDDRTVDSAFSMSKQEFTDMVEQVENAKKAIGHVSYELTEKEVKGLDGRRSLYVVADIAEGEILTPDNIRSIRPAHGLSPKYFNEVIGRKAKRNLAFGTPLSWQDVN
jgi:pseudaminic acid synthase